MENRETIIREAGKKIEEAYLALQKLTPKDKEELGNESMDLVGDYPLYGSTDGITYEEAILIAMLIR